MAPSYPKLAGQNKDYLISAMKAYRDGKRNDSMAIMMAAQMMSLSDSDIEELATFYSLQ
jgi:cytochrome c553